MYMVVCVLFSACSGDDVAENDAPVAVAFSASVPAFSTRSIVNSTSDLQTQGFGVFAYYTGSTPWATAAATATPNFMYNQQVSGSTWTYSPVKYWPNDNQPADDQTPAAQGSQEHSYLSFFAYTPYNGTGLTLSGSSATGAPTITYTWAKTNDLLYAAPVQDCYKTMAAGYGTVTGRVPFMFRHALAMVDFKVRRKLSTGAVITLSSLDITSDGNTGGTFNLGSSSWTATTGDNAHPLNYTSPGISVTAYTDDDAHLIGSALMMPGTVTMTYDIDYSVGSTDYTPVATAMTPVTLVMGYRYTIMFIIDGDMIESYVLREREAEQW